MWARAILVLAVGCFDPKPPAGVPCAANGDCPDNQRCVAGVCDGTETPDVDACPPSICPTLKPSNGLTTGLLAGAIAPLAAQDVLFDTDTGAISGGALMIRPAGIGNVNGIGFHVVGSLGVFTALSFSNIGMWTARGTRPLVLYAATTIDIIGTLDVGATTSTGVAGGGDGSVGDPRVPCEGQDGRFKASLNVGAGGGGGGGGTAGSPGAMTAADGGGATGGGGGGTLCASIPSTIPLLGGLGGGAGGTENMNVRGGTGGAGGGAIALVAMQHVAIVGNVAAPGAGGETIAAGSGGAGGGGGGAILVESLAVTSQGRLIAHGGGGGPTQSTTGTRGQRGHVADTNAALGGSGAGNGGTRVLAPTAGTTGSDGGGGGGGGAVGRIEIRSRATPIVLGPVSPMAVMSTAEIE